MKNLFLIFIVIFSLNIANAQWTLQNTGGVIETSLNSVYFIDNNTGYAVGGSAGTLMLQYIYKTTDGGINWIQQSSGTSNQLHSVYFINANTGYAVGGIYWNGIILKTTDGGTNWTVNLSLTGTGFTDLYSVFFTDSIIGYAVGYNRILKTTNGGSNWSQTNINHILRSVFFTDANTGIAVGDSGTILKTTDAGASWVAQSVAGNTDLSSVFFTDTNTGYIVGNSGTILKTTDAGTNWLTQTIAANVYLTSVFFSDINTGYIVGGDIYGSSIILKTTNGGVSWVSMSSPTTEYLNCVYFPSSAIGYVVGSTLSIFKYNAILGIDENNKTIVVEVYPNPAKDHLMINLQSNKMQQNTIVSIYDFQGKLLLQQKINQTKTDLNIAGFANGIYIVKVNNDKECTQSKFVKE